jgi:hypothetical protein
VPASKLLHACEQPLFETPAQLASLLHHDSHAPCAPLLLLHAIEPAAKAASSINRFI